MESREKTSKGRKLAMLLSGLLAAFGVFLALLGNAAWTSDHSNGLEVAMTGAGMVIIGFGVFCVVRFKIWWETG